MDRRYFEHILASRSGNLYTGMTSGRMRRICEHREGRVPGFTSKYRVHRLVYFESFQDVRVAIRREKEIKGWRREKKLRLIERDNPTWADLAEHLSAKQQNPKADPSHRSPKPGERVRDDNVA